MLKLLVPLALVLFLISSFAFFDGWPFRDRSTSETPSEVDDRTNDQEDVRRQADPKSEGSTDQEGGDVEAWRKRLDELSKKEPEDYRRALSRAVLSDDLPRDFRFGLLPALRTVNDAVVYSTTPFSRASFYKVKNGDNLSKIAVAVRKQHRNNVTPSFIMAMNRLTSDALKVGDTLKIPTDDLSIVVRKGDYKLYLLLGDVIAKDFDVGIGKDDSTPLGAFKIGGKTKNPAWTKPDGKVVRFGDPEHIIGTRWMSFDDDRGRTSFGIHGTVEEETVGHAASAGCIRMRRSDVEQVYELIPEGAVVTIRE